jgi:hypothetical protein
MATGARETIISSSCLSFELAPASVSRADMSRFLMVAWAIHLDLIPNEVGCTIPNLEELVVGLPHCFSVWRNCSTPSKTRCNSGNRSHAGGA